MASKGKDKARSKSKAKGSKVKSPRKIANKDFTKGNDLKNLNDFLDKALLHKDPSPTLQQELLSHASALARKMITDGEEKIKKTALTFGRKVIKTTEFKGGESVLNEMVHNITSLIKLNSEEAVAASTKHLQSFWATPEEARTEKQLKAVKGSLNKLSYAQRRCYIDQTKKFTETIKFASAQENEAIGWFWRGHLDPRERKEHVALEGTFYVFPDSWAVKEGKVVLTKDKNSDLVKHPGDDVYCRCHSEFVYSLSKVPKEFLSKSDQA